VPKVEVFYSPLALHGSLKQLSFALPRLVAQALHAEENKDAHLTETDIVVSFHEFGPLDTHRYDVEITILANDYPERSANLQTERMPALKTEVRKTLSDWLSFDVYILLGKGGFEEHRPSRATEDELREFFRSRLDKGVTLILLSGEYINGTCAGLGCAYGDEDRSVNLHGKKDYKPYKYNFPLDHIRWAAACLN
jgi:hypothetical protein